MLKGAIPVSLAYRVRTHAFCAANGQYMLFRRAAYDQIGGYAAVRTDAVDDSLWTCCASIMILILTSLTAPAYHFCSTLFYHDLDFAQPHLHGPRRAIGPGIIRNGCERGGLARRGICRLRRPIEMAGPAVRLVRVTLAGVDSRVKRTSDGS